jgi:hypothetical protein
MTAKDNTRCKDVHLQCGLSIDMIIKSSLVRKTLDNVTCVMIAFENFHKQLFEGSSGTSISSIVTGVSGVTNVSTPTIPKPMKHGAYDSTTPKAREGGIRYADINIIPSPLNRKELVSELSNKSLKEGARKPSCSKKVSLDVSNKKTSQGLTYNILSRMDKDTLISKKKENDLSGLSKGGYNTGQYTDNHPSTAKNISRVKDNNIIQQMRKLPSYGYFNDK